MSRVHSILNGVIGGDSDYQWMVITVKNKKVKKFIRFGKAAGILNDAEIKKGEERELILKIVNAPFTHGVQRKFEEKVLKEKITVLINEKIPSWRDSISQRYFLLRIPKRTVWLCFIVLNSQVFGRKGKNRTVYEEFKHW